MSPALAMALAILCLWLALRLWRRAAAAARLGLPAARVVAADLEGGRAPDKPLISHRHRLVGRPDLILQRAGQLIPVEIKPRRRAAAPYESDRMQLAAYCLLLEETTGRAPDHGLLCYAHQTWEVPYDATVRAWVLDTLADLNASAAAGDIARSHDEPARCAGCGLADNCGEALATMANSE